MTVVMKLFGVKETQHAMRHVPRQVQFRHLRIGMNAGCGILKRSAQGYINDETGLLSKSLSVKVKIPDASHNRAHHGKPAYGVIGPKRNFVRASVRAASGKSRLLSDKKAFNRVMGGGRVSVRNPARYAHLVHGGTKSHVVSAKRVKKLSDGRTIFGSSVTVRAKPNRFLSKAVASSGAAAQAKVVSKLHEGLIEESQKMIATFPSNLALSR